MRICLSPSRHRFFEGRTWNRQTLSQHAEKFDVKVFVGRVSNLLEKVAPSSCLREIAETRKNLILDPINSEQWAVSGKL